MDIVSTCLGIVPVPYLGAAFSIFRTIWTTVEKFEQGKVRLQALGYCLAQVLCTIDTNTREDQYYLSRAQPQLEELERWAVDL
jgi:hypothetical protein